MAFPTCWSRLHRDAQSALRASGRAPHPLPSASTRWNRAENCLSVSRNPKERWSCSRKSFGAREQANSLCAASRPVLGRKGRRRRRKVRLVPSIIATAGVGRGGRSQRVLFDCGRRGGNGPAHRELGFARDRAERDLASRVSSWGVIIDGVRSVMQGRGRRVFPPRQSTPLASVGGKTGRPWRGWRGLPRGRPG